VSSCWKIPILRQEFRPLTSVFLPVKLQYLDTLVIFAVVSIFTNVPVNEALEVITNKPDNNYALAEACVLYFEAILELLEVRLRAMGDEFLDGKDGTKVSSLLPTVTNICMRYVDKMDLDLTPYKLSLCLLYIDDMFVVCLHGRERLHN
jgi:hypothetical protein